MRLDSDIGSVTIIGDKDILTPFCDSDWGILLFGETAAGSIGFLDCFGKVVSVVRIDVEDTVAFLLAGVLDDVIPNWSSKSIGFDATSRDVDTCATKRFGCVTTV